MADPLVVEDISEDAIDQSAVYLTQLLHEEYPSMNLTKGSVFYDQLIRPAAIFHATNRTDIADLRNSFSPTIIAEDPDAADPDIVTDVYANYGVTRYEGDKATGYVAMILSSLATTAVPANSVFTADGLNFVVDQAYIGVTTADAVVSSSERLIDERSDGSFVFTVPVTAEAVGDAYRMKRNTRFTVSPVIANVIDIVASADFEGGLASETNAELVERTRTGIAPSTFSGRAQVESLIRDEIEGIQSVSEVGFGDSEMLRDRHNIFEISTGGKTDIYTRTADVPDEIKVTKTCVYLGSNLWSVVISRDDAPGFYLITAIVTKGTTGFTGGLPVTGETRGLDLTQETDWVQNIEGGMVEGAYSRYQTATLTFEDTATPEGAAVGLTAEYDVYILRMANIKPTNDLTVDRSKRPPCGDYLVRAPIPAFTAVSIQIEQRPNTGTIDKDAVKQAVASRVNGLGFSTGRVWAGLIIDAAGGAIEQGGSATITPMDMRAIIYPPDTVPAGPINLQDPDELKIPDLSERGVSQRTTCFYLDLDSISVNVIPMDTKAIY